MTTTLTLNSPEARRALARCTRLLLKWADESETADGVEFGDPLPSAAGTLALQRDVHAHDMPVSGLAQVRGVADG